MFGWDDVVPPGPLKADQLNQLARTVLQILRASGDGVDIDLGPGAMNFRVPPPPVRLRARVWADVAAEDETDTPCAKQAYAWQQRRPLSCGRWEDDPNGLSGSVAKLNPAFLQGTGTVADNTDVELVPGAAFVNTDNKVVQEWTILGGVSTGGDKRVRITNFFVKDTNPPVSSPSPLCYYPGVVQSLSSAGWVDTSTLVWVVFWYTYGYVPPVSGGPGVPSTVVLCDGTGAHDASPEGFDYAPDNGGFPVHPNNGESRPVWGCAEYAAGVVTRCDPVTGLPVLDLGG